MTPPDTTTLIAEIRTVVLAARSAVARQVNLLHVMTNFEIGWRIVEHEQGGAARAAYGKAVLEQVSAELTAEFGRGFSVENLRLFRKFYLTYRDRITISQTASTISVQGLSAGGAEISQTPSGESGRARPGQPPFRVAWSHYAFLIGVRDPAERAFYELEAAGGGWSIQELRRQFDSSLYERLALSRDKAGVRALSIQGQVVERPSDLLKEPLVLEFLGMEERPGYSESDLEGRIIDKLEHFLLELGKGFLFEGRQRRFTFDDEHYFIDLVFYNRLLRCFVLVDLKIGRLTHQDLGQMQMYVNHYDRNVKLPEERPTVGIILCKKKRDALVEITLPANANIHAREYLLALPSKDDLRQKLLEWAGEAP
jgi:predicted nuclease of restriction endonuclease-like (RecB) superfamily